MNTNTIHTISQINPSYKSTAKIDHQRIALRSINSKLEAVREAVEIAAGSYFENLADLEAVRWYLGSYYRSLENFHVDGTEGGYSDLL